MAIKLVLEGPGGRLINTRKRVGFTLVVGEQWGVES